MFANLRTSLGHRSIRDNVARAEGYPDPGARVVFACHIATKAGASREAVEHYLDTLKAEAIACFPAAPLPTPREVIVTVAKESGEAVAAVVAADQQPGDGAWDRAQREVREAIDALSSFLRVRYNGIGVRAIR